MKDQRLIYADPCDLDTLRQALKDADPDNRLCPILMDRIYIQKEAIELLPEIIKEHSKGNKVRRIYIPQSLRTDTLKWLSFLHKSHGPIFLNRFGSPISPGGIRSQLKTIALSYHMTPEMVHPHAFRHRFAKSFIEKCGDISLLADLLGHDSIETTRGYLMKSS